MFNIGPMELILILIVVLIVFGPGRLPDVARAMGKAVSEFRKASSGVQSVWNEVTRERTPQAANSASERFKANPEEQPLTAITEETGDKDTVNTETAG